MYNQREKSGQTQDARTEIISVKRTEAHYLQSNDHSVLLQSGYLDKCKEKRRLERALLKHLKILAEAEATTLGNSVKRIPRMINSEEQAAC